MNRRKYKAVIFDMDGTVLDTAEDLTLAINYALKQTGHRHDFTPDETKLFFGSGIRTAISRALAAEAGAPLDHTILEVEADNQSEKERAKILAEYVPYYEAHCNDHTAPYPGIPGLLQALRHASVQTAVVSNKPDPAVRILAEKHFPGQFTAAIGERSGIKRKPAPDLVLRILCEMDISPEEALYTGDSEIDIQTARNAGMDCAAVTWGFRNRTYLQQLRPAFLADTCEELLEYITLL